MRIVAAALCYFLIVFGVGFALGPARVFWLEPRLGETTATVCEAPFLAVAMVLASRWLPVKLKLPMSGGSLAAMGLGALVLQQLADFAVASFLRGISPQQQIARLARPAGLVYLVLLIMFAAMPLLANWRRRLPDAQSRRGSAERK